MFKRASFAVLICLAACILAIAIAAPDSDKPLLRLRLFTVDPSHLDQLPIPQELMLESYPAGTDGLYIVQFGGPITSEQRASLVDEGATILGYMPDYAYLMAMDAETWASVSMWPAEGHQSAVWAGLYQPAFKISPELVEFCAEPDDGLCSIVIQQYGVGQESLDALAEAVLSSGASASIAASSQWKAKQRLRVDVAGEDLQQLLTQVARRANVVWIERYYEPEILNDNSRWICQSYVSGSTPVWDNGIRGEGQVVAVADTGLDADMCFFYDDTYGLPGSALNNGQRKTIAYYDLAGNGDWDTHGHGTHCAGTIAGDNFETEGEYDLGDGMAFDAKLVIQDVGAGGSLVGLPGDLNTLFSQAMNAGARVHSNSWGSGVNSYTAYAQDIDEFMWDNPRFLVVFAAGNDGPNTNTVGSPSTAKDVVTAGASENIYSGQDPENVAGFSSNGPTADGRNKPTVCATGHSVRSAASDANAHSYNCGLTYMSGTSMACPTTAGLAALVRQYYTDGYYPSGEPNASDAFLPSAALLKATLVNSGANMTGNYTDGPIPSTGQGWGRILLDDALYFPGDDRQLMVYDVSPGLYTGQNDSHQVAASGECKLEITLVWTDYPSSLSASVNLVNDLDLKVEAPGAVYYGNNYSGGSSVPGGSRDRLNVVECVQIDAPAPGAYEVVVEAHNVPHGPQPYALVITGATDNMPPELSNGRVSPESGDEEATFTYTVHYYDSDGDEPVTSAVFINGSSKTMSLSSGEASDGTYTYETLLPSGTHHYHFYFVDAHGGATKLPSSGSYSGPSVDGAAPTSSCTCAAYSGYPITVNFTASDAQSGVLKTDLYYKYESGSWTFTGKSKAGNAGYFTFNQTDGEGTYYFYTIATDTAGNEESPPASADAHTIYDSHAPESSCSGPAFASASFNISFTSADGDGSGVDRTYLWFKYGGGSWLPVEGSQSGTSGSFSFTPANGNGSYYFYTISVDHAGNEESAPQSADCEVQVETVRPESHCTAPRLTNQRDVSIVFEASDAKSGVESVRLWYRQDQGYWTDSELVETGQTGVFEFHITGGEGKWYFYTIATDRAGNVELAPQTADTFLILDETKPASLCIAPECTQMGNISVAFTASDALSNVRATKLFAKYEAGEFQDTGMAETGNSGHFSYPASEGEGSYYFYTLAEDNAGNVEEAPSGYDVQTVLDGSVPSSTCYSPAAASTIFTITFDADDEGCGIGHVDLFYSFNDGGFVFWGQPADGSSSSFEFAPPDGDGEYAFYTIATDLGGNEEAAPSTPDAATSFDTVPASSSCTCPAYSTEPTMHIEFEVLAEGSQVTTTQLWYRVQEAEFAYSGLEAPGETGTLDFVAPDGEAVYEFYTIATDEAGNVEQAPAAPDASCAFDQTAPQSSCTSPDAANSVPFAVEFMAADAVSGVAQTELLFKLGAGDWEHSGLFQTGETGHFDFTAPYGEGTYHFAAVCADNAGNEEVFTEIADSSTLFDENIPLSSCTSPASVAQTTVTVVYEASGGLSGLDLVELWYTFDGGEPQDSGLTASSGQGQFVFDADSGDGQYGFFTIAVNQAQMREQQPQTPDSVTLVDASNPETTCDSPQYTTEPSVEVGFFAADVHSAVDSVSLYYKMEGNDWELFETVEGGGSGAFTFDAFAAEGKYYFDAVATDALGNAETPGASACSTTLYDHTPPVSSCTSPTYAAGSTVEVQFESSDNVSGISRVDLYYQFGEGDWSQFGSVEDAGVGQFSFNLAQQEGTWGFAVIGLDPAGNAEELPVDAQTTTVVDWTPPEVSVSGPSWARLATVDIDYEASDAVSGFHEALLWHRFNGGAWQQSGVSSGQPSGALQFPLEGNEGGYDFYVEAKDLAQNSTGEPDEPQVSLVYDATAPTSSCVAPEYATVSPIVVEYDVDEALSNQVFTKLYYRLGDEPFQAAGDAADGFAGEFAFEPEQDGIYTFCTVSNDLAGNSETTGGKTQVCSTTFDTVPPSSSCVAPSFTNASIATVSFTAFDDASGVLRTELWVSYEGGDYENTGLSADGDAGHFLFSLESGEGAYSFYTISVDAASNAEAAKTTPDATLVCDRTSPTSESQSPAYATGEFDVTFVATESTSAVASVSLYYMFGDSEWLDTGLMEETSEGVFHFDPQDGDGTYHFASRALDLAGNWETLPQEADAVTIVDTVPPISFASCPDMTNASQVEVSFEASDALTGVAVVDLYYSHRGGPFARTSHSSSEASGSFMFEFEDGDGLYSFYTLATDKAGGAEAAPIEPDCTVLLDTAAPESSCESPELATEASIEVSYAALDAGSGVAETALFYRMAGSTGWADTGLSSAGGTGLFQFTFPQGAGQYEFQTVSTDAVGNVEPLDETPCSGTFYQAGPPGLWVSTDSLDFEPVQIGNLGVLKLTVGNSGESNLVVDAIETSGEPYHFAGPASFTVLPDEDINLNVFFLPPEPMVLPGQLVIHSNDPTVPEKTVAMSGSVSDDDTPFITLATDRPEYHLSDTIWLVYTLGNPGVAVTADAYAAVQFPDGSLYFLPSLDAAPAPAPLHLPAGYYTAPTLLLTYDILDPLPEGDYAVYAALCVPGTQFDFISQLSVATFTYN